MAIEIAVGYVIGRIAYEIIEILFLLLLKLLTEN